MNAATARLVRLVSVPVTFSLNLGQHSTRGWGKLDWQTLCPASSVFGIMMVLCGFGCIQDWFLSSYSACVVPILVHFCKSYYAQQKNVTLCFLNFVFLFSGSIFWGDVLQQNRQWASAQVSTPQNARGWDCQYSAPIVQAIVHSLFVIASALVWSAKCYVVQRCSCYDNE